ncbi:Competence protein [hydrothermal vent metagenome]|uniref:Competence protein n=1 Tax=hydrothermal vent metagenome TaxID=652676 RepID=A0A1W1D4J6_9ZZZZ
MQLEKVSFLDSKKEILLFLKIIFILFSYSLLIEYNNYLHLTQFSSSIVHTTVLKQYKKTKITKHHKSKKYQVLKLKSNQGFQFYTTVPQSFPNIKGKKITLEIFPKKLTFYQYMTNFYTYSKILAIQQQNTKLQLNHLIQIQHKDNNISAIYQALYTATPLPYKLQTYFSALGISHLFAISGFHLGVLATILYFLFRYPYTFFQNRYFPFRSYNVDSMIFISLILLGYLLFLGTPPSLLRAYAMLLIGFILYDRGYNIFSMQTLLITLVMLLALFPRLFFEIGFWLSMSGVFYIFLFFLYFKNISKILQFLFLPIWIYLCMLPFSLVIFSTFSIYHPISIFITSLFTIFYPLSIFFHLIAMGDIFDIFLHKLLLLDIPITKVSLSPYFLYFHIFFSFLALFFKKTLYLLLFSSGLFFLIALLQT